MTYREAGSAFLAAERQRCWFYGMEWVVPKFSNTKIDKAGAALTQPPSWMEPNDFNDALEIVENHRASHSFPLLIFRIGLSDRAKRIDPTVLVVQRIKRLPSLEVKLRRFPQMRLSHMQDIGGCRAVVKNVAMVRKLVTSYENSSIKHKCLRTDDYITTPRDSGYRGMHLVYRYYSDRKQTYNGLKIEIQIRSRLQHAWATAVETIDTFTGQALKGGKGERDWERFFALMATYIANKENTPRVPRTPKTNTDLKWRIMYLARTLEVDAHLQAYRMTIQKLEQDVKGAQYYLLELDSHAWTVNIIGYKRRQYDQALERNAEFEKTNVNKSWLDSVLVSADSLEELKRAYPNYIADTHVFLGILNEVLGEVKPS